MCVVVGFVGDYSSSGLYLVAFFTLHYFRLAALRLDIDLQLEILEV